MSDLMYLKGGDQEEHFLGVQTNYCSPDGLGVPLWSLERSGELFFLPQLLTICDFSAFPTFLPIAATTALSVGDHMLLAKCSLPLADI